MDRRALSGISPFLLVPLLLCLIQSQLSPSFYPWISALPQFEKCLVAPFVAFGWQYLTSNLVTYTILAVALLLMAGRAGTPTVAKQFLFLLVAVPLVTAVVKTAIGYPGTGLGFSGVVFALAGLVAISVIRAAPEGHIPASLLIAGGVLVLAVIPLLVPPVFALPDGRHFFTDVVGHWCGFLVGCGVAGAYPLVEVRRPWAGLVVLAYFALAALPMVA
ncbi:MAG: rhomboid family intramembrane serine protease [Bacilli bacterium]|jgi:hypothetical protein